MFRLHKDFRRFLARHRAALTERLMALFVLGPTHDPHDEVEWQDSWEQLRQGLARFPWFEPVALELFGGKYDPAVLGFPVRLLARVTPASDIRDWGAIRAWGKELGERLERRLE